MNLDVLAALVGNDAAVIAEVLTAFRESAALSRGRDDTQHRRRRRPAASDAAHKLKSGGPGDRRLAPRRPVRAHRGAGDRRERAAS